MGYMGCVKVWSVNGGFRVFVKSGLAKKIFIQKDLEIWNICSIFAVEKRGKNPTDWYTKETTFWTTSAVTTICWW